MDDRRHRFITDGYPPTRQAQRRPCNDGGLLPPGTPRTRRPRPPLQPARLRARPNRAPSPADARRRAPPRSKMQVSNLPETGGRDPLTPWLAGDAVAAPRCTATTSEWAVPPPAL